MRRCEKRSQRKLLLLVGLLGWGWAGPARADVWEFTLGRGESGEPACERVKVDEAAEPDALRVRLVGTAEAGAPRLRVEGAPGTELPLAEEAGAFTLRIPKEKLPEGTVQLVVGDVECEPFQAPGPASGTGAASDEGQDAAERVWNWDAAAWWETEGRKQLRKFRARQGFPKETRFLVHYATGDRAAPFPASISEREPVQVVLIADARKELSAELVVSSCEDVQPFRVMKPASAEGQLQAKKEEPPEWRLVPVGSLLQCGAGRLAYTLRLTKPEEVSAATQVRVRPVSNVAATVVYGFDFVKERSFGVVDGRVEQREDEAGLGLRVGLTWFLPWGVDYEDMKPHNHVANLVFAVDPEAPTERFMTGLALTPTGGLSLVLGVSVHRRTALAGGLTPGAPFTGPGDVPTRREWSAAGVRPFIGLGLDDNVYRAFRDKLSGQRE